MACFTASDATDATAMMGSGCVHIRVERCKWFVQSEDSLIQIAARFATNWLQIWHFNPEILHPDSALPPSKEIWIGHLYEVRVRKCESMRGFGVAAAGAVGA